MTILEIIQTRLYQFVNSEYNEKYLLCSTLKIHLIITCRYGLYLETLHFSIKLDVSAIAEAFRQDSNETFQMHETCDMVSTEAVNCGARANTEKKNKFQCLNSYKMEHWSITFYQLYKTNNFGFYQSWDGKDIRWNSFETNERTHPPNTKKVTCF